MSRDYDHYSRLLVWAIMRKFKHGMRQWQISTVYGHTDVDRQEVGREGTQGGERMSATKELRRLLDERGVEYDTDDEDGCEFTEWMANGLEWEADSRGELVSLMPVMLITPEQAIAATLGSCNCSNTARTVNERGRATTQARSRVGAFSRAPTARLYFRSTR